MKEQNGFSATHFQVVEFEVLNFNELTLDGWMHVNQVCCSVEETRYLKKGGMSVKQV